MSVKDKNNSGDYVFDNLVNYGNVNENLKKWAEAAGIRKPSPNHKSRHAFATMMLTLGADLYTTSKLLGHSNVETTQIYLASLDTSVVDKTNSIILKSL